MLFGWPVGLVIPAMTLLAAMLIETMLPLERRPLRRVQGILFQLASLVLGGLLALPLEMIWSAIGLEIFPPLESWAGIWSFAILFILIDFLGYWEHRFEHHFLWRLHKVHHSPTDLHAATTFGHPFQGLSTLVLIGFPISLLNAGTLPLSVSIASAFWVYFIHSPTSLNLPLLRRFLVDNHSHRIHHSVAPEHFDKNFAIVFPIWDRLFGTEHQLRPGEWPAVGIDEPPPADLIDFLLMPIQTNRGAHASKTVALRVPTTEIA